MIIYLAYNIPQITLWYAATFTFFNLLILPCLGNTQTKTYLLKFFPGKFHPAIIPDLFLCQMFYILVPMMANPIH